MDDEKQQAVSTDNYRNYFSHRLDKLGGGVGILLHNDINATRLSSHTTPTISTIWLMIDINAYSPIIAGCSYHPPNATNATSLNHITTTILQLTGQHSSAKFILTGDLINLPISVMSEQLGLTDLVNFSYATTSVRFDTNRH